MIDLSTGEAGAIYRRVLADPADDTSRLVLADFLQENGDEERAEYVRKAIAFARCGPPHRKFGYDLGGAEVMRPRGPDYWQFFSSEYDPGEVRVGERVDVKRHRLKASQKGLHEKSKVFRGLVVVKVTPDEDLDGCDYVVKRDEASGPWKGGALDRRCDALLQRHVNRWRRGRVCPDCQGRPFAQDNESACTSCHATGFSGALSEAVRRSAASENFPRWVVDADWSRGFVGGVLVPTVWDFVEHGGEWSRRLWSQWPVESAAATDRTPYGRAYLGFGLDHGGQMFGWRFRGDRLDPGLETLPPVIWAGLEPDLAEGDWAWYAGREQAVADLSRSIVKYGRKKAGL